MYTGLTSFLGPLLLLELEEGILERTLHLEHSAGASTLDVEPEPRLTAESKMNSGIRMKMRQSRAGKNVCVYVCVCVCVCVTEREKRERHRDQGGKTIDITSRLVVIETPGRT
jgi:hypothetical protein